MLDENLIGTFVASPHFHASCNEWQQEHDLGRQLSPSFVLALHHFCTFLQLTLMSLRVTPTPESHGKSKLACPGQMFALAFFPFFQQRLPCPGSLACRPNRARMAGKMRSPPLCETYQTWNNKRLNKPNIWIRAA